MSSHWFFCYAFSPFLTQNSIPTPMLHHMRIFSTYIILITLLYGQIHQLTYINQHSFQFNPKSFHSYDPSYYRSIFGIFPNNSFNTVSLCILIRSITRIIEFDQKSQFFPNGFPNPPPIIIRNPNSLGIAISIIRKNINTNNNRTNPLPDNYGRNLHVLPLSFPLFSFSLQLLTSSVLPIFHVKTLLS